MKKNVGRVDSALRIIIGLVLMVLAFTNQIGVWGWIGVIPLVTGIFNFCPLYALLKLSTAK